MEKDKIDALEELKSLIQKEIQFSRQYEDNNFNNDEKTGFLDGLNQSNRFIEKLELTYNQ